MPDTLEFFSTPQRHVRYVKVSFGNVGGCCRAQEASRGGGVSCDTVEKDKKGPSSRFHCPKLVGIHLSALNQRNCNLTPAAAMKLFTFTILTVFAVYIAVPAIATDFARFSIQVSGIDKLLSSIRQTRGM